LRYLRFFFAAFLTTFFFVGFFFECFVLRPGGAPMMPFTKEGGSLAGKDSEISSSILFKRCFGLAGMPAPSRERNGWLRLLVPLWQTWG
jgi:hypothetical protein